MKTSLVWLGAALVVVELGACGGKVVVDQDSSSGNGAGGSGASSSVGPSSVAASSTGAGAASTTSGPGSGASGPTGSGGAGGGIPETCSDCVNQQAMGQCAMAEQQCNADPQCTQTVNCMNDCNFTNPCVDMCFGQFGGGSAFFNLVGCTICSQCFEPCQSSSLITFCLDG